VLANRSVKSVPIAIRFASGQQANYTLAAGQVIPIRTGEPVEIGYYYGEDLRRYTLDPYRIYYFQNGIGGLTVAELGIEQAAPIDHVVPVRPTDHRQNTTPVLEDGRRRQYAEITLKVLVDDEEQASPQEWQARLTKRVAQASKILERHAWVKLRIVAFDTWKSTDGTLDFQQALSEFERTVDPGPARVALGFSSQYGRQQALQGGTKLGGTRGPFHPYIVCREWPQRVTKPEFVEVLVHEVGHYLGCAHSIEPDSAMRPQLADHSRSTRLDDIRFDPLNTMIMNLVSVEMRDYNVFRFNRMGFSTKLRLFNIYREMYRVLPQASLAKDYIKRLGPLVVRAANTSGSGTVSPATGK